MYQVTFSIGTEYVNWFYAVEQKLKQRLSDHAIMVTRGQPKRLFVAIACENNHKKAVAAALRDILIEIFSVQAKRHYFSETLKMPMLTEEKFNILLTALVEFDSCLDKEIIKQTLKLESGLNLDGLYNFSFSKLKKRWQDIGQLTQENAIYLTDNEIFFELIKYMFSSITPKTESVSLYYDGEKYTIIDRLAKQVLKEAYTDEELLCSLISIAPISLELRGKRLSSSTRKKISAIFGSEPITMSKFPS